jgi:transcriptional antiterminator RfaH
MSRIRTPEPQRSQPATETGRPDPLVPLSHAEGRAWHVVYTNIKCEFRAKLGLQAKGFEVFLPTYERWIRHARYKKKALRALFTRYLFVRFDIDREEWYWPICSTDGVEDLLRSNDIPLRVPDHLILELQRAQNAGLFDETSELVRLAKGSAVKPIVGPFADVVGRLKKADDRARVEVLFKILGGERVVRFKIGDLRPV